MQEWANLLSRVLAATTVDELQSLRRYFFDAWIQFSEIHKKKETNYVFEWRFRYDSVFTVLDRALNAGNLNAAKDSMTSNLEALIKYQDNISSLGDSSLVNENKTVRRLEYVERLKTLNKDSFNMQGAVLFMYQTNEALRIIHTFTPFDSHVFSYSYIDLKCAERTLSDSAHKWANMSGRKSNSQDNFYRVQREIKTALTAIIFELEDALNKGELSL